MKDEPRLDWLLYVALGFTDPGPHIPNDAPTLSKDGKMWIPQTVASRMRELISLDVAMAFLKGRGDGRNRGIQSLKELASALEIYQTLTNVNNFKQAPMGDGDTCRWNRGGDSYVGQVLQRIQKVYSFGAIYRRKCTFCGVRCVQWDDGSIELEQRECDRRGAPRDSTTMWLFTVCCSEH